MADNEELKRVYDIFTTVWRFFKKYADVKSTDEYWENVVNESGQIAKKYGNGRLCRDLLLSVLSELERKEKELRARREEKSGSG